MNEIEIDISKAGQCVKLATQKYFTYEDGVIMRVSIQFIDKNNQQIQLKDCPSNTNATHSVLLYRPSDALNSWKIVDPTYVLKEELLDFRKYIKALIKKYEQQFDYIRISWKIDGMINKWLLEEGHFEILPKEIYE
jgi:hypothetical protein